MLTNGYHRALRVFKSGHSRGWSRALSRIQRVWWKGRWGHLQKYYRMIQSCIYESGTEDEARRCIPGCSGGFLAKARSADFILTSKMSTYIYSICQNLWRKELDRKKRGFLTRKRFANRLTWKSPSGKKYSRVPGTNGRTCRKVWCTIILNDMSMQENRDKLGFATPTRQDRRNINANKN